jgi:hypothetical protein
MSESARDSADGASTDESTSGSRPRRRKNRFAKYRFVFAILSFVCLLVVLEVASYVVIVAKGHQERRGKYPYNRMVSGYTVFKNVPGYDMGSSTLREQPSDPDVVLDEYGFLSEKPISKPKSPRTVRVFIMGGSAAFGAGQNSAYHAVHPYPDGVHSYPRNIAGQLRDFLAQEDSDVTYEVINAAAYARRFHQSTALYMETISQLSPDYIVNIDGWNDIGSLASGSPYADAEKMLPAVIDLKTRSESWLNRSNTYYVLSTAYDKYRVNSTKSKAALPNDSDRAASRKRYASRKPDYIQLSRRFEQLLRYHISVLQADGTKLVFVLQPMLPRSETNKRLSAIEKKMLEHTRGQTGNDSLELLQFFLDDYFSDRCREIIDDSGEIYMDANRELVGLKSDVEFYTDYCHLTSAGNKILAEMIGEKILADRWQDSNIE